MEPYLSQRPPMRPRDKGRATLGRMFPGLVLSALGAGMGLIAQGQPAWTGGNVGPGLMAQLLAMGVFGLGAVWAVLCALRPGPGIPLAGCGGDAGEVAPRRRASAPALLGAVLAFALSLPFLGLVLAAGLAAGLAAWGAGERSARALTVTAGGLMALVVLVGTVLLPPTAPLWPTL